MTLLNTETTSYHIVVIKINSFKQSQWNGKFVKVLILIF